MRRRGGSAGASGKANSRSRLSRPVAFPPLRYIPVLASALTGSVDEREHRLDQPVSCEAERGKRNRGEQRFNSDAVLVADNRQRRADGSDDAD